jgi:erythromycin esterase
LSHVYFWTWRTQEVLDLIRWLHDYNASLPADQRIAFYGVDFQYPGGAIRRIMNWVPASLTGLRSQLNDGYACVTPYVNDEQGSFKLFLDSAAATTRTQCVAGAQAALDAIRAQSAALRSAVGEESYALHERLAMSVVQFATRAVARTSISFRDSVMAQNAMWALRRKTGRVFLWAHNFHISKNALSMGRWLNDSLGTQYQAIGFMFDSGSFNAKMDTATAPPAALHVGQASDSTYESFFRQFKSTIYFDSHGSTDVNVRRFLIGPRKMREIGALFYPDAPDFFTRQVSLFNEFDIMIFVPESAPTRLLPFTP